MKITDRPVLITDAPAPYEEQYAARKRRYALLMGGRLLLFVLAASTYTLSPWLAAGLLALSVPLPWMAVLIANDAPAPAHRGRSPGRHRRARSTGGQPLARHDCSA